MSFEMQCTSILIIHHGRMTMDTLLRVLFLQNLTVDRTFLIDNYLMGKIHKKQPMITLGAVHGLRLVRKIAKEVRSKITERTTTTQKGELGKRSFKVKFQSLIVVRRVSNTSTTLRNKQKRHTQNRFLFVFWEYVQ